MNCSNCGEPYDLKTNTPYILNCGHTGKLNNKSLVKNFTPKKGKILVGKTLK